MSSDPASKPSEYAYIPWTVSLRMMERHCGCHKWVVDDADLSSISLETCVLLDYGKQYLPPTSGTDARALQEGAERATYCKILYNDRIPLLNPNQRRVSAEKYRELQRENEQLRQYIMKLKSAGGDTMREFVP